MKAAEIREWARRYIRDAPSFDMGEEDLIAGFLAGLEAAEAMKQIGDIDGEVIRASDVTALIAEARKAAGK